MAGPLGNLEQVGLGGFRNIRRGDDASNFVSRQINLMLMETFPWQPDIEAKVLNEKIKLFSF